MKYMHIIYITIIVFLVITFITMANKSSKVKYVTNDNQLIYLSTDKADGISYYCYLNIGKEKANIYPELYDMEHECASNFNGIKVDESNKSIMVYLNPILEQKKFSISLNGWNITVD